MIFKDPNSHIIVIFVFTFKIWIFMKNEMEKKINFFYLSIKDNFNCYRMNFFEIQLCFMIYQD